MSLTHSPNPTRKSLSSLVLNPLLTFSVHFDFTTLSLHNIFKTYDHNAIYFAGEWFNTDTEAIISQALQTGGGPNVSDAYTINGLPGLLYNCSTKGNVKRVLYGQAQREAMLALGPKTNLRGKEKKGSLDLNHVPG